MEMVFRVKDFKEGTADLFIEKFKKKHPDGTASYKKLPDPLTGEETDVLVLDDGVKENPYYVEGNNK